MILPTFFVDYSSKIFQIAFLSHSFKIFYGKYNTNQMKTTVYQVIDEDGIVYGSYFDEGEAKLCKDVEQFASEIKTLGDRDWETVVFI